MSKKNANSATMANSNNDDGGGTPTSHLRKKSGRTYATALRKGGIEESKKGSSKGNDTKMSTPDPKPTTTMMEKAVGKSKPTSVKRYNFKCSKSKKVRFETHTKLVKLVHEIMQVYIAQDEGHNKSSCLLW